MLEVFLKHLSKFLKFLHEIFFWEKDYQVLVADIKSFIVYAVIILETRPKTTILAVFCQFLEFRAVPFHANL